MLLIALALAAPPDWAQIAKSYPSMPMVADVSATSGAAFLCGGGGGIEGDGLAAVAPGLSRERLLLPALLLPTLGCGRSPDLLLATRPMRFLDGGICEMCMRIGAA